MNTPAYPLSRIDALADHAEAAGRDLTDSEARQIDDLMDEHLRINPSPEGRRMQAEFKTVTRVPPAGGPSVHIPQNRDPILEAIRCGLKPTADRGFILEHDQEIRRAMPWLDSHEEMQHGFMVRIPASVAKQSGTTTGGADNLQPALGVSYDDTLTVTGDAVSDASIVAALGGRVITGLVEKSHSFTTQTGKMDAGHVAIDSALPAAADPAFGNVVAEPHLVGGVHELRLSSIFAQHPMIGTTSFIGREMVRGLADEVNRAVTSGDATGSPAEPDGIDKLATAATQSTVPVAADTTLAALNAIIDEGQNYIQASDQEMVSRSKFLHHPLFGRALEGVPTFTGSGTSVWSDINAGAACRTSYVGTVALPVTVGTPDTAPGYLVMDPELSLVYCQWGVMNISVNPYETSVYASGGTLVRVYMMYDFKVLDAGRILAATVDLAP